MSKIGKKPIAIPEGVEASHSSGSVIVKGKIGTITVPLLSHLALKAEAKTLLISPLAGHKQARANWGTMAALIKNALAGVSEGFTKKLIIEGIGYKAQMDGKNAIMLSVGYSHPVRFVVPEGVTATVEKSIITISGIDKGIVGQTAANIRKIKKPEPYKGKGIRYDNEVVRRKQGKKVAGTGA